MGVKLSATWVRNRLFLVLAIFFFAEGLLSFTLLPLETTWDFHIFWGGARALNLGLDPYNVSGMRSMSIRDPYVHPIFFAELLQPLAHLPLMAAKMIWSGLSFIEAVVTVIILFSLSKVKLTLPSFLVGLALLMAFEPFSATILLGQTVSLVVFGLALSWLCLEQRRFFLAGLAFCLGATNPHLLTGVGLYYLYRALWKREYRLLLGMLAGGALLSLGFLIHPVYSKEWFTTVLFAIGNSQAQNNIQITLLHIFTNFLPHAANTVPLLATILALALGFSACVFAVRLWVKSGGRSTALDMSIAVMLTLIALPYAFHQDFLLCVLAVPALVLLRQQGLSVHKVAFLFLCLSTFFFSGLIGFLTGAVTPIMPFIYFAPFLSIAMFVLLYVKTPETFRKLLPWLAAFALLSLVGSCLPLVFGIGVIQYETVGIFIGLFLFMGAMWRWHPALTPPSANTLSDTTNDGTPEAPAVGAGAALAITRRFKRT